MHPVTSLSSASCVILVAFRIVLVMSSHGCHSIFSVVTCRLKTSLASRTSPHSFVKPSICGHLLRPILRIWYHFQDRF
ncbi:hypothetical protein D6D19_01678 [Aureobasidium pullulans]|uniref:Secreted protein n=1 Tax=Aureobasidium pullulans TaxID=5580 RepID=A0A4S9AGR7_AURPU|nr:hypothetical protein D6D19_01678 [Aureobasidium pullulans]